MVKDPENNVEKLRNGLDDIDGILSGPNQSKEDNRQDFIFLSHFLGTFFDIVWPTITGESTNTCRIEDIDVQEILTHIGEELKELSLDLKPFDKLNCYNHYVNILFQYKKKIEEIKKRIEREQDG